MKRPACAWIHFNNFAEKITRLNFLISLNNKLTAAYSIQMMFNEKISNKAHHTHIITAVTPSRTHCLFVHEWYNASYNLHRNVDMLISKKTRILLYKNSSRAICALIKKEKILDVAQAMYTSFTLSRYTVANYIIYFNKFWKKKLRSFRFC